MLPNVYDEKKNRVGNDYLLAESHHIPYLKQQVSPIKNFKPQERQISHSKQLEAQINFMLLGNQSRVNQLRYRCGRIINNEKSQRLIIAVIIFNSIMLGLGTFNFVFENNVLHKTFGTIDFICLAFFTLEMMLQIIYRKWQILRDNWLVFDFVVIAVSWVTQSMGIGRAFRILKVSRLVVRMYDLRDLVEALMLCIPRICAVGVLLLLVLYAYGVILTSLFRDLYADGYLDEDYFSRLDKTIFTLFQMMTMDNWSDIVKQVMVVYPWAWLPFISYIVITTFLIINLAVGVICNAVSDANRNEIETRVVQVSSEVGERNDIHIRALEEKIDALVRVVERLSNDHDHGKDHNSENPMLSYSNSTIESCDSKPSSNDNTVVHTNNSLI